MIDGHDFWDGAITRGMSQFCTHGRRVSVFEDAPANFYASLNATSHRSPEAVALVTDGGRSVTFRGLKQRTDRFAFELQSLLRPGDRVGLLLDTSVEFAVALYAASRSGIVVVPIPTKHKEPEIEALLTMSGVQMIIAERRFESMKCVNSVGIVRWVEEGKVSLGSGDTDVSRQLREPVSDRDADCILMYTSGTTARSKGVLLTNRNVGHAIVAYQRILDLGPDDSSIIPIPIYHITGLVALLGLFIHIGGRLYLHRRFDADRVLATVRDEDITFIHASPTVFALLLGKSKQYPHLPSLRTFACGAAHMPVTRIKELHAWLPDVEFRTIYGLTETSSPGLIFPGDAATSAHCGSSGWPIPGLRLSIRDDAGEEVPSGERGEVWLYGTNVLRRYDAITTDALTPEGWLNTGDIGYATDDGYVFIVDRSKDMVNRGGEKVWCIDVEEELRRVPGVADAAVVGVPHSIYGEEPAAVITEDGTNPLNEAGIIKVLSERLARYQIPQQIRVVDEIPMTPNLKVDKTAIRELFEPRE